MFLFKKSINKPQQHYRLTPHYNKEGSRLMILQIVSTKLVVNLHKYVWRSQSFQQQVIRKMIPASQKNNSDSKYEKAAKPNHRHTGRESSGKYKEGQQSKI